MPGLLIPGMDAFAHCEALVRAADKDRFIATLFAPAEHRGGLHALYAFNAEIARVREVVREPLAGEIRLQWWSDLIAGGRRDEVAAYPVAAALTETMARYRLPVERLAVLLDARRFDLYDEPMARLADLEAYARGASSGLIALAGQILEDGRAGETGVLAEHAGLAHALTGLLRALPVHAARGQLFVPLEMLERHGADRRDVASRQATPQLRAALAELRRLARRHLAQARQAMAAAPLAVFPALLPVALVGPLLARMERSDHDPFAPVEIASWRRQWLIWRAARRPERIFA
jgi:15-cis-phytoene synthase